MLLLALLGGQDLLDRQEALATLEERLGGSEGDAECLRAAGGVSGQ
jgi:hypothetical protein